LVKLIQPELSQSAETQAPIASGSKPKLSLSTAPIQGAATSLSAPAGPSQAASIEQEGTSSPFTEYREPKAEGEKSDHPQPSQQSDQFQGCIFASLRLSQGVTTIVEVT
ncbi:hypothetical protein FRB94_014184, partial [Tulasnella sp. JGI-2019a]